MAPIDEGVDLPLHQRIPFVFAVAAVLAMGAPVAPAVAASDSVVIKGHVSTYGGAPIHGLVVEVAGTSGSIAPMSVSTTSSGRYSITVRPETTYSITFLDHDTDGDSIDDRRFVAKTGHVRVETSDYRLDKKLHRVSSPDTVVVDGIARNFGGGPVARIRVTLSGTLADGTPVTKQTTTAPDGWYAVVVPAHERYAIVFSDTASVARYLRTTGHIRVGDDDVRFSKRLHRQPK